MKKLLAEIRNCTVCAEYLPMGPRPVLNASENSRVLIIGQAPGHKVHLSGIPWKDPSGDRLREWLNVNEDQFYDPDNFAIVPMGFCFPGRGKSGDLPPRPECAPLWHQHLLTKMKDIRLTLLIGAYAQKYYLPAYKKETLTNLVRDYKKHLPQYLPLPHPSPRNKFWLKNNPWFEEEVVAELQKLIRLALP